MDTALHLTLFGRTYCHLCDDMAAALAPLLQEFGATLHIVDVDAEPEIEARFDELVPVLMLGQPSDLRPDSQEICHYFVEADKVRTALQGAASASPTSGFTA